MILGCVQPSYLAWMPLFERMSISDVFVYLDDVEYSKNSFHNRNRIKTADGPLLLTVPVLYKRSSRAFINEMAINYGTRWFKKHWQSIALNYSKAPYFGEIAPDIEKILLCRWNNLADLNITLIEVLKNYLGITTPTFRSSQVIVAGKGNEKLVNICKQFKATHFVVKPNTTHYHPVEFFKERGIEFEYFTPQNIQYKQQYGPFIPNMCALDYACNCGANSFKELTV